jgi:hypothetical protein
VDGVFWCKNRILALRFEMSVELVGWSTVHRQEKHQTSTRWGNRSSQSMRMVDDATAQYTLQLKLREVAVVDREPNTNSPFKPRLKSSGDGSESQLIVPYITASHMQSITIIR